MGDDRPLKNDRRLTDTEALMWAVERDPSMRSTFLNVTFLDRAPDVARFRSRMERAVAAIPRLRQRVVAPGLPLAAPSWEFDPDFDLDFHVRHIAAPSPGGDRDLLDLAARLYSDSFDPQRPLWQYTIVEGLAGDRAALLAKMHHTITDGVGGVRMSAMFLDLERNPADDSEPSPAEPEREPEADREGVLESVGAALRRPIDLTWRAVGGAVESAKDPLGTAQSMARQLVITDKSRSPLWAGVRSMGRRFEILSADMGAAKQAAKSLGGTLNDLYVTGVAGGAAAYHRAKGVEVDELRVSMPVSTRTDHSAGGNSFAPSRVLVPAGITDPVARFTAVHERLSQVKNERALGLADAVAGILSTLPTPIIVRLARQQVETVDFACSNVRGAPFDLFVAGAKVLSNHPMGPTAGTAFNITLLSYLDRLDLGLNIDTAAVDDAELLRDSIQDGIDEVIAAGT